MNRLSRLLVVSLAATLAVVWVAAGCGSSTVTSAPGRVEKVTLQLNWFHEAEFVGYYVAAAKGFYADKNLRVKILEGGPGDPAIDHVLNGTADFAISSFGEQKQAIAEKKPTIAVMAAFQIPPLVIFSLAESGIKEPADLAGKRVGVTTDYWKAVLEETMSSAGVDPARVTQVEVEPDSLTPLYDHQVDAWLGYAQDEPIRAETAGHSVTTIFPADYGVGGYEGLLLANAGTAKQRPAVVRRFVRASVSGWRYAVEHPQQAARILLKWAPKPGLQFQKLAVSAVSPLVDTPQAPVGWIDQLRWQQLMGPAFEPTRPGYTMTFYGPPH